MFQPCLLVAAITYYFSILLRQGIHHFLSHGLGYAQPILDNNLLCFLLHQPSTTTTSTLELLATTGTTSSCLASKFLMIMLIPSE